MLKTGANIEAKDNRGRTALIIATEYEHSQAMGLLLKAGADTEARREMRRWTPLMIAARFETSNLAELLKAGADTEAKDNEGKTALIIAAEYGCSQATAELLKAKADIEAKDTYGRTALRVATGKRRHKVTAQLLKAGARVEEAKAGAKVGEARETNIKVQSPDAHKVSFSTEAELENFICSHWYHTIFGNAFDIYKDTEGRSGKQYPTDLRERIDILAISNDKETFLVIELKVGKAPDTVVAQCQRYMGFVKDKVAKNGQKVRGAIVATEKDKKMERALSEASNVDFYTYKVDYKAVQMSRVE